MAMNSSYDSNVTSFPPFACITTRGFVLGGVRATLRLEGLAVFVISVAAFAKLHASWWFFAALFLIPDVSFFAYLVNPRAGAIAYNSLHSYIAPLCVGLLACFGQATSLVPIVLIWIAHIGFDRAAGYGLKYSSAFGDTHLGYKGRPRNHANAT